LIVDSKEIHKIDSTVLANLYIIAVQAGININRHRTFPSGCKYNMAFGGDIHKLAKISMVNNISFQPTTSLNAIKIVSLERFGF
jgi:hypothetical protein